MPEQNERVRAYKEFWALYLRAHRRPENRLLHYVGAGSALLSLALFIVSGEPLWVLAAPVVGYGFAWVGHIFVEKNRPLTFREPLWSFVSLWRMVALAASGRLGPELKKHGVR